MNSSFIAKPRLSHFGKSPEEKEIIKRMQTTELNQKLKNYPKQQLAPFLMSNQNFNNGRTTLKPLDHTKSTFGKTLRDSNDYNEGKSSNAVRANVLPYQLMFEEM